MESAHETDFGITYSFGDTATAPLVRRTIAMDVPAEVTADMLQEILLERADKVIADLCAVFDAAEAALVASGYKDGKQVEILMGAAAYCVNNLLAPSPSAKYAHMYDRVQRLLNYKADIARHMGARSADVMLTYTMPVWETLRMLDSLFAERLQAGVPS